MPLPKPPLIPEFALKHMSKIKNIPFLSKLASSSVHNPTPEELHGHKKAQRLAYQCAVEIAKELKPGWSEKQTTDLMDTWLQDHGVNNFFHKSFAWFGDRSGFVGFKQYWDFMPKKKRLAENDVIILDTAPIVSGYAGDIGFTFSLKPNEDLLAARTLLLKLRKDILTMFQSEWTSKKIWTKVDEEFKENNYVNCYERYPFSVLGHRVHKVPMSWIPGLTIPFSIHSYWHLMSRGLIPELLGPWHEGELKGVWAIEPHLGTNKFGAKFEEIIVVSDESIYWLDEDVPHLNLPQGLF